MMEPDSNGRLLRENLLRIQKKVKEGQALTKAQRRFLADVEDDRLDRAFVSWREVS